MKQKKENKIWFPLLVHHLEVEWSEGLLQYTQKSAMKTEDIIFVELHQKGVKHFLLLHLTLFKLG